MTTPILTVGIDVGSSYIKAVLVEYSWNPKVVVEKLEKVRKRNPSSVAEDLLAQLLNGNGTAYENVAYIATTGEGEMVRRKTGHFYSMTTHARGGTFLYPGCKTVVDLGALYVRAIKVNDSGRVLDYKMTGQCASGSGQFIENISRYLGLSIEEVGDISLQSKNPETPSGICAVLAETDVINMVSKGVATTDIVKGIHLSIANRIVKLLISLKAESPVALTGGMALNTGLVQAMEELSLQTNARWNFHVSRDSIFAGAIGAALWAGFRYHKLKDLK